MHTGNRVHKLAVLAGMVPGLLQVTLLLWPAMYQSIFGRFLLLQLSGVGSVLIINFLLALFDVVTRIGSRGGGGLLLRALYGKRIAEVMSASQELNQLRLAGHFARTISEHAGIVVSATILSFGGVTGGLSLDFAAQVLLQGWVLQHILLLTCTQKLLVPAASTHMLVTSVLEDVLQLE